MKKLLIVAACIALLTAGCNEDAPIMVKDKDGNVYKTVKIGNQVWMAQNLNIKTGDSWCYKDNPTNCEKYGRLYTWKAAKSACPEGWRLPSKDEFKTLIDFLGGEEVAGEKLKSTSGWNGNGNGTDEFGFSALPAGHRVSSGGYYTEGNSADVWSSTEGVSGIVLMQLYYNYNYALLGFHDKDDGFSVRCIKD